MRKSVSGVDNIDTSLPGSSECSNVSPDASGTRDCIIERQEKDASNVGDVHVRADDETGLWTGTGMAVSLTGEGSAMPFPSSTSLSLSRDLTGVHSSHQLDSGDAVDSTAECLHLSLEELRHHRMSFGKRIWSSVDPYKEEVEGEVWKKVRTVSFLPGSPTDLVSGSQGETADDDISEVDDDGADMDDELERGVDDGEAEEHQHQHEHEHDHAMDTSSSLPSPTVVTDGQTERWRERQEKAMMLAVKLAALASTSTSASTTTSTSCPQKSSTSKDVSEESCVDDGSVCQGIVSQEDGQTQGQGQGQVQGQGQGQVQSHDSLKVGKTMGTTKSGVERKRRRSKTEMHGNSHASIAHAINIKSSTSTSTSSSTSSSTGSNSPKCTTESQPLSPSSAQSGTSNPSKGQKGKKDLPSKPDFRETKYLLSKMAILNYVKLHGNLQVVSTFSVPSTESWPVVTWGLNLGKLVSNIKSGYSYYDKREELEAMGVVFKVTGLSSITDFDFDSVLLALTVYKVKHCDLSVPAKFTVPSDSTQWPTDCWGIRLGEFTKGFKNGDYGITETQRSSLRNIGFEFNHTGSCSKQHVIERKSALISSVVGGSNTAVQENGNATEGDHSSDSTIGNTDVRIVEEDSVEEVVESESISETENDKDVDMIIDIKKMSGMLKVPCLAT